MFKIQHPNNERERKMYVRSLYASAILFFAISIALIATIATKATWSLPSVLLITPIFYMVDRGIEKYYKNKLKPDLFVDTDYTDKAHLLLTQFRQQLEQMCDLYEFKVELYNFARQFPGGNAEYSHDLQQLIDKCQKIQPVITKKALAIDYNWPQC